MSNRLGIMGGGHMGASLLAGLHTEHHFTIELFEPDSARAAELQQRYGIKLASSNQSLAENCDILLLAVKPQIAPAIAEDIRSIITVRKPLVISIMAGITSAQLKSWVGEHTPIVRTMPNLPAQIQAGITALFSPDNLSLTQRQTAEMILKAVGNVLWLEDEALMNAVTAISGSGPAYFLWVQEILESSAVQLGLPLALAKQLVQQTALGTAAMLAQSTMSAKELRAQVTSKGGTTEAALTILESSPIADIFQQAVSAACQRAVTLSQGK